MRTNYIILLVALLFVSLILNMVSFTQLNYYSHQPKVDLPKEWPLIDKCDIIRGEVRNDTLVLTFDHESIVVNNVDYTVEFMNPKGDTRIKSKDTTYIVKFEDIEETFEKDNL